MNTARELWGQSASFNCLAILRGLSDEMKKEKVVSDHEHDDEYSPCCDAPVTPMGLCSDCYEHC